MFSENKIRSFNMRYIIDERGCWIWIGHISKHGYGRFTSPIGTSAHRFSFALHKGPLTKGLVVDHICRVRNCVNPKHLREISSAMNTMIGHGIATRHILKKYCLNGHPFNLENTKIVIKKSGNKGRRCKTCALESMHRRDEKRLKEAIQKRKNARA